MCWKGLSYPPIRDPKIWYVGSNFVIVNGGYHGCSPLCIDERVTGSLSLWLQEGYHNVGAAGPGDRDSLCTHLTEGILIGIPLSVYYPGSSQRQEEGHDGLGGVNTV